MCWTDDPCADFLRHDAEQQAWLDKLPKCSECGQPIQDDEAYYINDEWICQECLNNNYKRWVDDYI